MRNTSKRYQNAREKVNPRETYSLEEAINLLQEMPSPKFDETVEMSAKLLVDPRQSSQMVRGTVALPHGSGKTVRVLVFTENPDVAIEAGADYAGLEDLMEKIEGGWLDFDVAIATPTAMQQVRKVARVLGPRGLMPNPKSGTVTENVAEGIQQVKAGRVEYKMDKTANIHVICGKKSFGKEQLQENIQTIIESLQQSRPDGIRGPFIKNVTISATMSPGVKLNREHFTTI